MSAAAEKKISARPDGQLDRQATLGSRLREGQECRLGGTKPTSRHVCLWSLLGGKRTTWARVLYSGWKLAPRPCIIQAMLVKLAELTKLRLVLQAGADELTAEAESRHEAPTALATLRVATKIKELDRQIEVLNRKLSQGHARRRTG